MSLYLPKGPGSPGNFQPGFQMQLTLDGGFWTGSGLSLGSAGSAEGAGTFAFFPEELKKHG